jgi:hypothetical protein
MNIILNKIFIINRTTQLHQAQHSWVFLFVIEVVDLDMEKDKNPEEVTIEIGTNGQEAYKTLVEWVKTVPKTINELKKNGTEEDLKTYQMQIKMVLDKLKQIELKLDND